MVDTCWIWVSLPYATFGIRALDDVIVEAAPIARWMVGKPGSVVRAWILGKGGSYQALDYGAHKGRLARVTCA